MSSAYPVSSCYSGGFDHPVQRIQARAEELSGVSYEEAHFIDNVNLGEKIGEFEMMGLSEAFYKTMATAASSPRREPQPRPYKWTIEL